MSSISSESPVPTVRLFGLVEIPDQTTAAGRAAVARRLGDGLDARQPPTIATADDSRRAPADDAPAFAPRAYAGDNEHCDGHRAGFSALAGRDPATGITIDLLRGGGEVGFSNTRARAGMARVGWRSDDGRNNADLDVFSVDAGAGTRNKDQSRGVNAGAVANLVGVEGTKSIGASEVTAGVALSLGLEGSLGTRDIDNDGDTEYCVRASVGFLTLGTCIEI